jgi:NAD(P)-dependent dehydrogenase (short-subunit alcohol dehydrogenase family)
MGDLRFDGRVALVTGAGRGLGRAYAELLGARGACVIVNDLAPECVDRTGADGLPDVLRSIREAGGEADILYADMGDQSSVRQLAASALDQYGRVDVLIHNAGMADGTLDEHLDLHLRGAVGLTKEIWSGMVDRRYGRILFTTSGVGLFGASARRDGPGAPPTDFGEAWLYGLAKMGVVGFMRHLALRGPHANITSNAIAPVAVTAAMRVATSKMSVEENPRLRWILEQCTPEIAAPVAAYLVHEECPLNGEILRAGGGHVGRIFIAETQGYTNPALQIEDVRDNVSQILDEAGYTVPAKSGSG